MNFRRIIIPLLLVITMLFGMSGCAIKTTASSEPTTPEALVEAYYNCIISKKYDTAYTKYYSVISKSIISEEDFVSRISTDIFSSGKTYTDILIQNTQIVDGTEETIYKISGLLKYTEADEEKTEDFSEYVILQKNTGFYRILHRGYLSFKVYTMPPSAEKKVRAVEAVVFNTVEGKELELKMLNDTDSVFSVGKDDKGPLIEVVADEITYPYRYAEPVKINPGDETTFVGVYPGLAKSVSKITISSIYSVGQDGKVIEDDNGRLYSVSVV